MAVHAVAITLYRLTVGTLGYGVATYCAVAAYDNWPTAPWWARIVFTVGGVGAAIIGGTMMVRAKERS